MKKLLLSIGAFILTFFGVFTIINVFIVLIFPVSWNDVVTSPGWCVSYFFVGMMLSIAVVNEIIDDF